MHFLTIFRVIKYLWSHNAIAVFLILEVYVVTYSSSFQLCVISREGLVFSSAVMLKYTCILTKLVGDFPWMRS